MSLRGEILLHPVESSPDHQLSRLVPLFGYEPAAERYIAHMPATVVAYIELLVTFEETANVPKDLLCLIAIVSSEAALSTYVRARYVARALKEGLSKEKIDALSEYKDSPLFSEAERAAMAFASKCSQSPSAAGKHDFTELLRFFDAEQVTEILALVCILCVLQRFSNAIKIPAEDGAATDNTARTSA